MQREDKIMKSRNRLTTPLKGQFRFERTGDVISLYYGDMLLGWELVSGFCNIDEAKKSLISDALLDIERALKEYGACGRA
jgi:hypothetical protein